MRLTLLILSFVSFSFCLLVNDFIKVKLPRNISSEMEEEQAPYVNMNDDHLLYSIKDSHANTWSVSLSKKYKGDWSRAVEIDPLNKSKKLNLVGGYAINPEGTQIIFTSKKYGGIGNYDLWETHLEGNSWTEATNLGKPINSNTNDAAPAFSRDGKSIYFMRCTSIDNNQCKDCRIYISEQKGKTWSTPNLVNIDQAPANLTFPKIGSDDNTLYFSSNNSVFVSKRENKQWTKPVKIPYLSTSGDDHFYSFTKQSNRIYFSEQGDNSMDLFVGKLDNDHRAEQLSELRIVAKSNHKAQESELIIYESDKNTFISKTDSKENGRLALLLKPGQYIYLLNTKDEMGFTIDTLHVNNPEKFHAILRQPDLSPNDSLYLHTGNTKHEVYDKLFYKGLTGAIKARKIKDTVQVHTPHDNFFSDEFLNNLKKSNTLVKFVTDTCLHETDEILVIF